MEKSNGEIWLKSRWRPMMAVVYMIIVFFDFVIAPVILMLFSTFILQSEVIIWDPLTTQDGAMFHIAMGAAIGITAWSRGQEKMLGKS
jgi:hypothetical protein